MSGGLCDAACQNGDKIIYLCGETSDDTFKAEDRKKAKALSEGQLIQKLLNHACRQMGQRIL